MPSSAGEMRIFQGPPGTGKTYRAKREAVRIIDGSVPPDDKAASDRHAELVAAGRVVWVTFHPSYSYEDFVEGFRPSKGAAGIEYLVSDGPFKRACEACGDDSFAARLSSLRPGQKVGANRYDVLKVSPDGAVLFSPVTRKDAVNREKEVFTDLWTLERFRDRGVAANELSHAGQDQELRTEVAQRAGVSTTLLASSGHYRALYEYLESASTPSQPVVLVIDEINRADLARVFGELLTLIETDKRRGAPEEASVVLPYSRDAFTVPAELSIIGTMNTADRSLAVLDVAFRRRFEFLDIEPDPSLCPDDWAGIPLASLLADWNERITFLESRDGRLGHSEVMEGRLERVRSHSNWDDDDDGRRRALAAVIRTKIVPLLLEYFYEDWRRADAVLGSSGLLREVAPNELTKELLDDYLEMDEVTFEIPTWWDPVSPDWDGDKFRDALS